MKYSWSCAIVVCGLVALTSSAMAAQEGKDAAKMAANTADEVPFVEGQAPPSAVNGEIWCLVTKPASYKKVTERVVVRPATFYYETLPAKFEAREETVQIAPEKKVAVPVPAVFKTETERRVVKPESSYYEVVPAVWADGEEQVQVKPDSDAYAVNPQAFTTATERVLVEPARSEWRKVDCNDKGAHIDRRESKDDCYTLIEIAARYETITKQVLSKDLDTPKLTEKGAMRTFRTKKLVKDAEVKKVVVPAEYETIEKQVLVTPASVRYETVPAQYATIKKMVQVEPETKRKVELPEKFETITHEMIDMPASLVWRRSSCAAVAPAAPKKDVVSRYGSIPGITSVDAENSK